MNLHMFTSPIFFFVCLLSFLFNMNFSTNMVTSSQFWIFDELSLFMTYMSCFVMFVSVLFSISFSSLTLTITFNFMLISCLFVFMSSNYLLIYIFYEASLIPILYIIMKWGSYPERSVSSIMLLIYTSVFTFPFMYILFMIYTLHSTLSWFIVSFSLFSNSEFTLIAMLIIFFTFAVKLPIYGLHYWLPMAHVEAPTFGSMILAGVLLKLGGVGLIRFSFFINFTTLKTYILAYLLIFLVYVTLVCSLQSDFKRLVAYSSVSHMMSIPIMLISSSMVGIKGVISLMFLHGISSPLMFMLVGVTYIMFNTRQLVLMRGLLVINPLLSFVMVLTFFFSVSAPPFPSFVSEVFFVFSSIAVWLGSFVFIALFLFLSMVYSVLWLTSINFLSPSNGLSFSNSTVAYSLMMSMLISSVMLPIVFSILFFFVF